MGRKKEEIVIKESDYLIHSKEKALKASITEGSLQSVAASMSSNFITPFALAIGANNFHIGLMSSLSGLSEPIGELRGSRLIEKHSRKKLIMKSRMLAILLYIPIIFLGYLFWKGLFIKYLPWALILIWAIVMGYVFGIANVSWLSWMGDIVPADGRGKYFAKRNRIIGFLGLVSFLTAGFLLDLFKTRGYVLLGFTVLFAGAFIFRYIAKQLVGRIFNPVFRVRKGYYFSFKEFVKRYDNFGKFAFYQAFFFMAINIASPFFAVYMLQDLKFNYLTFTVVSMSSTIFYLIFSPLAGKFSDKYGNLKLMYFAAFLFPIVPLLWIFLESPLSLIFLPGLISGMANASFVIGTTDFTYDCVSPQKRGLCFAYSALLVGFGILIGSFVGGALIQYLPISFISPLFFVFMVSCAMMVIVSIFFLPQLKEWRKTDKMKGFSVDFMHPFKMIHADIIWAKNFIHQKS